MAPMTTVGTRVRELRERRGWSRGELSRRADLTSDYIYRLESGRQTQPTTRTIIKLAGALDVPYEMLADDEASFPADISVVRGRQAPYPSYNPASHVSDYVEEHRPDILDEIIQEQADAGYEFDVTVIRQLLDTLLRAAKVQPGVLESAPVLLQQLRAVFDSLTTLETHRALVKQNIAMLIKFLSEPDTHSSEMPNGTVNGTAHNTNHKDMNGDAPPPPRRATGA